MNRFHQRSASPALKYHLKSLFKTRSKFVLLGFLGLLTVLVLLIFRPSAPMKTPSAAISDFLSLSIPLPAKSKDESYAIIIDAGSSGSRVYIYKYSDFLSISKASATHFEFKESPGISTLEVADVAKHVDPLLKFAMDAVPMEMRSETPIYLFATAGLRLVEEVKRKAILTEACSHAAKNYPFYITDCAFQFRVISGELEGSFQIDDGTFGFIDMGGASAQIAFEPTEEMKEEHLDDLKAVKIRAADGSEETKHLFVATFLGFGANKARDRYLEMISSKKTDVVIDPCLPKGLHLESSPLNLNGTGDFDACKTFVAPLLNKDKPCKENPCLFDGVHAPIKNFKNHKFLGVSNIFYTPQTVYDLAGVYSYKNFAQETKKLCETPWQDLHSRFQKEKIAHVDSEETLQNHCFKSTYVLSVLHEGLGMSKDVEDAHGRVLLESVDVIDGFSVSWTLGAAFLIASSSISPDIGSFGPSWFGIFVLVVVIGGGFVLYVKFRTSDGRAPYTDLSLFHQQQRDLEGVSINLASYTQNQNSLSPTGKSKSSWF